MIKKVIFEGFEPDAEFQQQAGRTLKRLLSAAPYKTSGSLKFKKGMNQLRGRVELMSFEGRFWEEAEGLNPAELLKKLEQSVQGQIKLWKKTRFDSAN